MNIKICKNEYKYKLGQSHVYHSLSILCEKYTCMHATIIDDLNGNIQQHLRYSIHTKLFYLQDFKPNSFINNLYTCTIT